MDFCSPFWAKSMSNLYTVQMELSCSHVFGMETTRHGMNLSLAFRMGLSQLLFGWKGDGIVPFYYLVGSMKLIGWMVFSTPSITVSQGGAHVSQWPHLLPLCPSPHLLHRAITPPPRAPRASSRLCLALALLRSQALWALSPLPLDHAILIAPPHLSRRHHGVIGSSMKKTT